MNDLSNGSTADNNKYSTIENAQSGICPADCNTLTPFLILLFVITLLTSLNQMPMLMVTLRSVTEIERPFALGLQLVILRLLGKVLFLVFYLTTVILIVYFSVYSFSSNIWSINRLDMHHVA